MAKKSFRWIAILFLLALGLRMILAGYCRGFLTDVYCFFGWANRAFEGGVAHFYAEDVFSDYPPGYIYILYVLGALLHLFRISDLSAACLLIIKTPALLCDLALGWLIYRMASQRLDERKAIFIAALYLFNPAVLQNSVVWGQVDSVFTLAVIGMCLLLERHKTVPAYFVYAAGVLLKPQTLVFTPLLLLGIYENVFAGGVEKKKFWRNLLGGLSAILCMLLCCLPFGLESVLNLYTDTLGSYPYVAVNAYNFWGLFGLNWVSQETKLFGLIAYSTVGTLVILVICVGAVILFLRRGKETDRYWVTGAFIITTMFLFSVRMHERYLYPAMVFLLLTFVCNQKRDFCNLYIFMSFVHYLNVWHVLNHYDPSAYNGKAFPILAISFASVAAGVYLYGVLCGVNMRGAVSPSVKAGGFLARWGRYESVPISSAKRQSSGSAKMGNRILPETDLQELPIVRRDWIYMAAVTCFYALFAFHNLGSMTAPASMHRTQVNENIMLTIPQGEQVSSLSCYLGYEHDAVFGMWVWDYAQSKWEHMQDVTFADVYKWNRVKLDAPVSGTICLVAGSREYELMELVLCDAEGRVIAPTDADKFPALFDEAELYDNDLSYLFNSYFDEIYYTRTAYEILHGLPTYEWTHPPFGKILMALGVWIFGENFFGFRFMGALFGCLMLPVMYLFGRNLCKNRESGLWIAFVFAFDFMHFTQTRITTIDVFVTFFVIVMYYFMEIYTRKNFRTDSLKNTFLPLGASGVAFGFGIASKWTGFYAGAGLALIFAAVCVKRFLESSALYQSTKKKAKSFWQSPFGREYLNKMMKTCLFCIVFFIVVPACIYLACYIPFRNNEPGMGLIARAWKNQGDMLRYHNGIDSTHPYSSSWYEWPTIVRPAFYYSQDLGNGMVRGISAFGNPLIWWAGIPAFFYMLYLGIVKRDRRGGFLCVGYLAQYLPWILVSRYTFIYHYFPSVPFVTLMVGYSLHRLVPPAQGRGNRKRAIVLFGYAAAVFGLFVMFYPVLSGAPVEWTYVEEKLRWLDGWVLALRPADM